MDRKLRWVIVLSALGVGIAALLAVAVMATGPQPETAGAPPLIPTPATSGPAATDAVTVVRYPCPESPSDTRFNHQYTLLRMAMECTKEEFGAFRLEQSSDVMNEKGILRRLDSGSEDIDVTSRPTSIADERVLTPVRIPLDRGLLGWRICLIRASDQARFDAITDLDGLRAMSIGQGRDWNDVAIYQSNGLQVVTGSVYEGLFDMLNKGRFDVFPRGVTEVFPEFDQRHANLPALAIERGLLIHYPYVSYFWVANSAKGARLRQRITKGLETMLSDGSLVRTFNEFYGPSIARADVRHRRIIEITNPTLPASVPLARRELWFDPLAAAP